MSTVRKIRRVKFHSLKRPKIRADMKKYNLYNLSRLKPPQTIDRTYFQQKWTAKSLTRAYHGRHVREGQWTRMFKRRPPSVVPMNPSYLAQHDGSDEAAGRGSGRQHLPQWLENERVDAKLLEREPQAKKDALEKGHVWEGKEGVREVWVKRTRTEELKKIRFEYGLPRNNEMTPYMQMVYHPLERRLDQAVWRALFASSARQARQWVVHGGVRVNGQKMRYPGYLLNPGDMFSVDPPRALWGLGANNGKLDRLRDILHTDMRIMRNPPPVKRRESRALSTQATQPADEAEDIDDEEFDDVEEDEEPGPETDIAAADLNARKKKLRDLLAQTREVVARGKEKKTINNKTKQMLRAFAKDVKRSQSQVRKFHNLDILALEDRFTELNDSMKRVPARTPEEEPEPQPESEQVVPEEETEERKKLRDGPRWVPRPYLSPFAFIPRYLEVNHAICSAVYLRHPVCGPGFAEVPTPYGLETGALAFNWYLRRR